MNLGRRTEQGIRVALALAVMTVSLAGAASADHVRVRYKGRPGYTYSPPRTYPVQRHYYYERSSGVPAFAGFVGGLILGSALSHPAPPPPPPPCYVYVDPYCDREFASYDEYLWHLRRFHHPRLVRVIDTGSGRCVHTRAYEDGAWVDVNAQWDDRDEDDYGDR